jgi:hypothetical protein
LTSPASCRGAKTSNQPPEGYSEQSGYKARGFKGQLFELFSRKSEIRGPWFSRPGLFFQLKNPAGAAFGLILRLYSCKEDYVKSLKAFFVPKIKK